MLAFGLALGTSANAAPFDLAPYLGLSPGSWAAFQNVATGAVSGYVTTQDASGQIVQTFYRFVGGAWVFDDAQIFAVSARRITYIGFNDGTATWLNDPPLAFPRRRDVNDSTVYKGVLRNQSTAQAVSVLTTLAITADGIGVTVPAGSFTGCIKLRFYSYSEGSSRDSVSVSCLNRSEVKTWYSKIKDTQVPTDEDQTDSQALIMIQAGDSNSPIP